MKILQHLTGKRLNKRKTIILSETKQMQRTRFFMVGLSKLILQKLCCIELFVWCIEVEITKVTLYEKGVWCIKRGITKLRPSLNICLMCSG